ncbi:MAG: hypothetical protein ACI9VN_003783 [Patescibacteria group bacterium]|jgi:hypothetical protein
MHGIYRNVIKAENQLYMIIGYVNTTYLRRFKPFLN